MLKYIAGILAGTGLFLVLCDLYAIPFYKTSKAVESLAKMQKGDNNGLNLWLKGLAEWLSRRIKINDFKREQLVSDLRTAQMDITPEMYKANAIVKSLIVGIFAVPALFIFPISAPFVLFLAVFLYSREIKSVGLRIKEKRSKIEYELPRLVFNIEKTLKHSRDVLYMIENYAENAGPELKHELKITAADMRSGNYEAAITRLESRVGSAMMSDVCRGLIGILRGDETEMYWATLSVKFNDYQRQLLRIEAQKVPKKVRRLSVCLLICFMLIYIVVIISQIASSLGVLFS